MKNKIILAGLILISLSSLGQNAILTGESGDGKKLKLIWFLKSWPKQSTGFFIGRRETGTKAWEFMNKDVIVPEIRKVKSYTHQGLTDNESDALNQKLLKLIATNKTREVSSQMFIEKIRSDSSALKAVSQVAALDYDMALITGFALVESAVPPTWNSIEYGLFVAKGNKPKQEPLSLFKWNKGETLRSDFSTRISFERMGRGQGIQLQWKIESPEFRNVMLAGFQVYRVENNQRIRLNQGPVFSKVGDQYFFQDRLHQVDSPVTYLITYLTTFGHEANLSQAIYEPQTLPAKYFPPENTQVSASGILGDKTISLRWSYSPENEKYLKGFRIERKVLPQGYFELPHTLSPGIRNYIDTGYLPPAKYIQYRVKAIYKDGFESVGKEELFYYLPNIELPSPVHLGGTYFNKEGKSGIKISWDKKQMGDTLTAGYQIFARNIYDGKFYLEASIPLIKTNEYDYEVKNLRAAEYKFVVTALTSYHTTGSFSDTLSVKVPGKILPVPSFREYQTDSNRIRLFWNYKEYGTRGFRIFQNGNMVASEFQLSGNVSQFQTPPLKYDVPYQFTLQAVSVNGVESSVSIPKVIILTRKR